MRRIWRHHLSTKLLMAFALVALLGVGTVTIVARQVTVSQLTLYVSRGGQIRAQRWAQLVAEYYSELGRSERTVSWEDIGEMFEDVPSIHAPRQGKGQGWGLEQGKQDTTPLSDDRILIAVPDGQVVFDTENELIGQSISADIQERGAPIVVDEQIVGTLLLTTQDLSGHSELELQFMDAVNQAVLWATLLVAIGSLTAVTLLSRQLVAPLRRLTTAAEAMARGDLSQRVVVKAQDEIGELGEAFNKMASDLETAEAQRRQMTADIAHELRNPLSIIRGNLEAMLDGIYPSDIEHLSPVYEETMLLQRLVEDLRLLSLADAGKLMLTRTNVDVVVLLSRVANSALAIAEDKKISLRVDVPQEKLVVDGDANRLRQVLGNLVSNAVCYTPEGGTITLRAYRDDDQVHISISDTGPGISAKDLPHIFDRFYRGDAARDRPSGGSGLGLAIARALIEAHGGTIKAESVLRKGATFSIVLLKA